MNKKILFGAALFLFLGVAFYSPQAQAAEVSEKVVLSAQEKAALEQSLVALTAVLSNLQNTLEKDKALPQNSDQIVAALSDINKSLAKINASMEGKALAIADNKSEISNGLSLKPKAVEQQKSGESVSQSAENDFAQAQASEESGSENVPASEESSSLMANIRSLFNFKVGIFLGILLLIGAAVFMFGRSKDDDKPKTESNNQLMKV